MTRYPEKTPTHVAEIIQSRFTFNDDDEVIACNSMYFSDLLGSDWASNRCFDASKPAEFYRAVKEAAVRKYGPLPF